MNEDMNENKRQVILDKYCEYRDLLIRFVASRLSDPSGADDIVQDIFVRLWTRVDKIDVTTLRPLMFTIASNLIEDTYRRAASHTAYRQYTEHQGMEYASTDEPLKFHELLHRHAETLNRLPAKRRKIYEKSFFEGWRNPDIAAAFGLSIRTVESQLLYSRQFIRASLAEFYPCARRV